ncbi:MAG TPA: RtcB family protein [bacterium]|nr:RtcB family protein [bacterium]
MHVLRDVDPDQQILIHSWADPIEPDALRQAANLARLSIARHHIAIMPDVHVGYGMPIGGVLATDNAVVPNAVGVDIGCGMRAVRTAYNTVEILPHLDTLLRQVLHDIPTGFSHHRQDQDCALFRHAPDVSVIQRELAAARRQLGTLGGGNHFIEVQKDDQDRVWVMIHSGSRNFGYKTAKEFHGQAQRWCAREGISLPDKDLAYLQLDTTAGQEYLAAMEYAQQFARENRRLLMAQTLQIVEKQVHTGACVIEAELDVHHNYAVWEEHYGQRLLVHRKGAVRARSDDLLIVPGSMGSYSYICRGKGEESSFCSSAHGAGRTMGRKEAIRSIPAEQVFREMEEAGILLKKQKHSDVAEECKQAYKDIDRVIAQQADLASVVLKLQPLGVVKG